MEPAREFTPKQEKFIAAYAGNLSEAAKIAGYSAPYVAGKRLFSDDKIRREIYGKRDSVLAPLIASAKERQIILTNIILDESIPVTHRIRAMEVLHTHQGGGISLAPAYDPLDAFRGMDKLELFNKLKEITATLEVELKGEGRI